MRTASFLLSILLLTAACGARSVNRGLARDLIAQIPGEGLEKEDIEVVNVTQVGGSEAIAQTNVKAAFRLERVRGNWVVREVRLGHGQWEKVGSFVQALEAVKTQETGEMLEKIAEAIRKYQEAKGALPVFSDYIGLSDLLSPQYLTPLIRLDSWRRPLAAERTAASVVLRSAGPDGRFGTKDDIVRKFP